MNKKTLVQLGSLCQAIDEVFNEWIKSGYSDDAIQQKLKLLKKVKKQLEEQKRGKLKSRIDYSDMADYVLERYRASYTEIYAGLAKYIINKK